jgi:molecular chaperone GrpE (heat shock protein)
MTQTTQPVSRVFIENMEKTRKIEAEEVTYDILAVCDSLNRLCEVLSRLDYAIKRKRIEASLVQKRQDDNNADKI